MWCQKEGFVGGASGPGDWGSTGVFAFEETRRQ